MLNSIIEVFIIKKVVKISLIVLACLIIISVIGAIVFINNSFEKAVPVLAYHDVLENPEADTDISIDKFEKQIKYLHDHNYKSLSLDEFYDWKNGKDIKGKKVLITFDDGKESYYTVIAPILKKYNMKAVIFLIGERLNTPGYLSDEQVKKLNEEYPNLEIESHSYALHYQEVARSEDYKVYESDMKKNEDYDYKYYAYPFGITNENYQKALKDNGYKLAFLFSPGKWANREQNDYAITRVPVYNSTSFTKFKLKVLLNIK